MGTIVTLACRHCGGMPRFAGTLSASELGCYATECPVRPGVFAKKGDDAALITLWNLSQQPLRSAIQDGKPSHDRAALQQIRDIVLGLHDAPEVASVDQTQKAPQQGEEPSVSGSVLTTSEVNEALRAHLWGDASPVFQSVPDRNREVG